jgi:diguanylate cyclase (GGDEF)-like protein
MKITFKDKDTVSGDVLSDSFYVSSVKSLYEDVLALIVGKITIAVAFLAIYLRTADIVVLALVVVLVVAGIARISLFHWFRHADAKGIATAQIPLWEKRYAIMATIFITLVGISDFLVLARHSDSVAQLFAIATTMGYLIGIAGRNFASDLIVRQQLLAASVPMVSGVILFGDGYHMLLGALLIPFFVALHSMSYRHRTMLFNAVKAALENREFATRFAVALDNVSHGLAMLDRNGEFVVANQQFSAIAGLPEAIELVGQRFEAVPPIAVFPENGDGRSQTLQLMFAECLETGRPTKLRYAVETDTIIEATFTPTDDAGGVFVLEDVTERVESEAEIRKLASFDPLTHLPNRRYFANEINRLLMGPDGLSACAVLFVDLDNFKDVNDSLGHAVGDKLLCAIALRMRSRLPENGMVCRFGGDEFVIVVPGKMRRKDCEKLADTVIAEVSKPMVIDGHAIGVGASIGIAMSPDNGTDYNDLLKVSDMALYDAKAKGRGCHSFYSDALGDVIRDRRALENDLRRAIERGEMQLHFQPLVNMHEKKIVTCEALIRWAHPERGNISPAIFIPVAEEIGIISQIGKFVLEQATQACAKWPDSVAVAVNVSSLQFQQSDVCGVVKTALAKSGLAASRLEVEVTESAMLGNVHETTAILNRLAKSGVRISLDDFGTGFSSLSYLHQLPLDKVKIDRSFIENIESDERSLVLLTGVTQLANELGLSITIEGVETAEQMHILCEKVHVDEMQGYLFGRAMPLDDISTLLWASAASPVNKSAARA